MALIILMMLTIGLIVWQLNRYPRRLSKGRFIAHKTIWQNHHRFEVEEVAFDDYQGAIHGYFLLVPDVLALGRVCEERYDFFDFYSVAIRFEDRSARLLRLVDRVRLIQSDTPIALDEFETMISDFAYGALK